MLSLGSQIPTEGCGIVFAQIDDKDEVVAFQILHTQAFFAEGLWARDGNAHLRTLCNLMLKFLKEHGAEGRELLTMTRGNEQGERIGKAAKYMGFEPLDWKVFRRTI
jgi:hypothetical protein